MSRSTLTLPFVLLLLDVWPLGRWRGRGDARRLLVEKLPLIALAGAAGWMAVLAQRAVGAVAPLEALPLAVRLQNALVSYVAYLRMVVWPTGLAYFYPHAAVVGSDGAGSGLATAGAGLLLAAVTTLAFVALRRQPWLTVGWLWYLGTLVPVIGVMQLGMQARADRYTYIPSVGLALAAVWGGVALVGRAPRWKRPLAVVAVVAVAACTVGTRAQVAYWKDNRSLAERALVVTEGNFRAHDLLGVVLRREGQDRLAAAEFRAALELNPACSDCRTNLAVVLSKLGHVDAAKVLFEQVMELDPEGKHATCLNGLGALLQREGDLQAAESHLDRALELEPDFAEARNNLGVVYERQGRLDAARSEFERAVRIAPEYALARKNLGGILQRQGDLEGGSQQLERAIELEPDMHEAHFKLAVVRVAQDRLTDAAAGFERVIALAPDFVAAHYNLGVVLQGLGQSDRAVAHLRRAIALDPQYADAQRLLDQLSRPGGAAQ